MNGKHLQEGVLGSLAGGVVFGLLMQMMGMISMIAGMVGSTSAVVGWLVHLVISAIFGVVYGLVAKEAWGVVQGLIYGAILWVFGPLIVMPAMMGMPLFMVNQGSLASLMGHLIYGAVLGWVFARQVAGKSTAADA